VSTKAYLPVSRVTQPAVVVSVYDVISVAFSWEDCL